MRCIEVEDRLETIHHEFYVQFAHYLFPPVVFNREPQSLDEQPPPILATHNTSIVRHYESLDSVSNELQQMKSLSTAVQAQKIDAVLQDIGAHRSRISRHVQHEWERYKIGRFSKEPVNVIPSENSLVGLSIGQYSCRF